MSKEDTAVVSVSILSIVGVWTMVIASMKRL